MVTTSEHNFIRLQEIFRLSDGMLEELKAICNETDKSVEALNDAEKGNTETIDWEKKAKLIEIEKSRLADFVEKSEYHPLFARELAATLKDVAPDKVEQQRSHLLKLCAERISSAYQLWTAIRFLQESTNQ